MISFEKIVIIGAGPAGYTASIYAARSMLNPLIITGPKPGGQLVSTTEVENYPGFNKIQGFELMEKVKIHALSLGVRQIDQTVEEVDFSEIPFHIKTSSNNIYIANCVILATGSEPKKLNLYNENKIKGLSVCATCDGFFYKNKKVTIIGSGNTAIADAIYLSKLSKKVFVINKNKNLNCEKALFEKINEIENIMIIHQSIVTKYIINEKNKIIALEIKTHKSSHSLKTDGVFIAIGTKPCTEIFKRFIKVDKKGYIITQSNSCKTNVNGIFAAGDITQTCLKQAIIAAGSGCLAALEAERFLCT